jgi:Na+-translocating ferredoxin:NAD+ oxidoreductase RNF subunit RnfB
MEILIAFLFMHLIALIAGAMLLIFSYLFSVKKNPLETALRECLPGINCGACGFKGCDDYAAALVEGKAEPNLCVPGTQKAADEISDILGIGRVQVKDMVAYVACNGHCGVTSPKARYEGVKTCRAASIVFGGHNACNHGCLGFGDCQAVCDYGAISICNGVAKIDPALCRACGKCVYVCPNKLIDVLPVKKQAVVLCSNCDKGADARKACKTACIGCMKCAKNCPAEAIRIENLHAVIDPEKCTGCGTCVEQCPQSCIVLLEK